MVHKMLYFAKKKKFSPTYKTACPSWDNGKTGEITFRTAKMDNSQ